MGNAGEFMAEYGWYLLGGFGGLVVLLLAWYCSDWVSRKLSDLAKSRHLNEVLLDENREVSKEVQRLRGEVTAGRVELERIKGARGNLENETTEKNKDLGKWRDHSGELEKRLQKANSEKHELREQKEKIEKELAEVKEERDRRVKELEEKAQKAAQESREYQQKAVRLDWRVRQVAQSGGRIWETPVKTSLPEFRKRTGSDPRHAVIISMLNMKGGVGKSTIAANLGAVLWKHFDRRVLLVDLDFQASLTSLCLPGADIDGLRRDRAFVQRAFQKRPAEFETIYPCLHRIRKDAACKCEVLGTDEDLCDIEEQLMMQWIIGETDDDIRFRMRNLLHSDLIQQRYDYIILDCPPRNTTASINALSASDYLMIPVLLDYTSTEAVPRLLSTVRRIKDNREVPLCPELEVLGVVANRVLQDGKLTPDEQQVWDELDNWCRDRWEGWDGSKHRFTRAIPDRVDFGRAAGRHELATLASQDLQRVFVDLAKQVEAKVEWGQGAKAARDAVTAKPAKPVATASAVGPAAPPKVAPPVFGAPPNQAASGGVVFPPTSNTPAGFPAFGAQFPQQGGAFPQVGAPKPQGAPAPLPPAAFPGNNVQFPNQPFLGGTPSGGNQIRYVPPRPSGTRKPRPQ
jgi:cellulose biosynthesis protein BcsQ